MTERTSAPFPHDDVQRTLDRISVPRQTRNQILIFLSEVAEKFLFFMIEYLHINALYHEDDLQPPDDLFCPDFLWHLELVSNGLCHDRYREAAVLLTLVSAFPSGGDTHLLQRCSAQLHQLLPFVVKGTLLEAALELFKLHGPYLRATHHNVSFLETLLQHELPPPSESDEELGGIASEEISPTSFHGE